MAAREQGPGALLLTFVRLSGPGWLQSAITLGGGTLANALYLGVLTGVAMLWWQPAAMLLGIVMLSAIGYVTLSTGERPFVALNRHVNPVLGWGWAIGTMMANLVWCMPQFALGTAAIRQNLLSDIFDPSLALIPDNVGKVVCVLVLFTVGFAVIQAYESRGLGRKVFDWTLKLMVGVVVISFFAVFVKLAMQRNFPWGEMGRGFIPSLTPLFNPAAVFSDLLSQTGPFEEFWREHILREQQSMMIAAAATAVGINMTFLLPYSMLDRGWDREFRGMAIFDLLTGLFIPFLMATTCVVIASATQFHGAADPRLVGLYEQRSPSAESEDRSTAEPLPGNLRTAYLRLVAARYAEEFKRNARDESHAEGSMTETAILAQMQELSNEELGEYLRATGLPEADLKLATMLIRRDAGHLASSLEPVLGRRVAQLLFGIGVLGMAVSTIIILMYINGFVICEMLGMPGNRQVHQAGAILAGVVGAVGSFVWTGGAAVYLAVPTSMFGMVLLPVAYFAFLSMMNSKSLMRENMPSGWTRIRWNVLMGISTVVATILSLWSISLSEHRIYGYWAFGGFAALVLLGRLIRGSGSAQATS